MERATDERGRYLPRGSHDRVATVHFQVTRELKTFIRETAEKRGQCTTDFLEAVVLAEKKRLEHGETSPARHIDEVQQAIGLADTWATQAKETLQMVRHRDREIKALKEQLADEKMVEVTEGVGLARKWLKTVLTEAELENFAAIPPNEKAANWSRLTGVLVHELGVPRRLKSGRPTISAADLWMYVRDYATPEQRAAIKNCLLGTEREDQTLLEADDVERA